MERKITDLKLQKRNTQRVNVYLDGEFAFGLSRMAAAWLEIGQTLTEAKIQELQAADEIEMAYQRALHFLSFRSRSEKEVRDNLKKHDFSDEVIQDVIGKLRRTRLVDDLEFARLWVENRSEFRPRGRRSLRVELYRKGISPDIIDQVIDGIDEDELAYRAASKQYRKYRKLDWDAFRTKMAGFLARRGFNYGVAAPVVQKVWEEKNSPDEIGTLDHSDQTY